MEEGGKAETFSSNVSMCILGGLAKFSTWMISLRSPLNGLPSSINDLRLGMVPIT